MAPELGMFALILAFVLSVSQAFFGLAGAWRGKAAWMAVARPAVTRTVRVRRHGVCLPGVLLREQRFLGAVRGAQFEFAAAAVLQGRGAVGRARGLAAAVDSDSVDLERGGGRLQPAAADELFRAACSESWA